MAATKKKLQGDQLYTPPSGLAVVGTRAHATLLAAEHQHERPHTPLMEFLPR